MYGAISGWGAVLNCVLKVGMFSVRVAGPFAPSQHYCVVSAHGRPVVRKVEGVRYALEDFTVNLGASGPSMLKQEQSDKRQ